MASSIDRIIEECIAENSKLAQGQNGAATVILIDDQPEVFQGLFRRVKEQGYGLDDITPKHRRRLANACTPKSLDGKAKDSWDFQTLRCLILSELAVFECDYGPNSKPLDQEEGERIYSKYVEIFTFTDSKLAKNLNKEKQTEDEKEEEFFPHPEAKEYNPEVFQEPMPEIVPNDFSWIPGGPAE